MLTSRQSSSLFYLTFGLASAHKETSLLLELLHSIMVDHSNSDGAYQMDTCYVMLTTGAPTGSVIC